MTDIYYKILNSNLIHDGIIFTKGLNVLPGDFDDEPQKYYDDNSCELPGNYCEHYGYSVFNINDIMYQI